jgi:hypothetical protein
MKRNKRLTIYDCDRCQFTFRKSTLRKQRGMLLCDGCFDSVLEIEPLNLRLRSPRVNSTTTTVVNSPTVFRIFGTTGVTALQRSNVLTRQGVTNSYYMQVIGYAVFLGTDVPTAITISANPQIVAAGSNGTLLTLEGTSDTASVTLQAGNGTDLTTSMVLKRGSSITLAYNSTSGLWKETSRSIGGIV